MCARLFVCVRACMCVCVSVWGGEYICRRCMCVFVFVCVCVRVCVCVCLSVSVCLFCLWKDFFKSGFEVGDRG